MMPVDKATPRGLEAVRVVRDYLTQKGLSPQEDPFEHGTAFRVSFDGPADQGIAQIHVDSERFAFVFMFPGFVPPEHRLKVAEFIIRTNWGLIEGSFEMNLDNGAVGYKSGLDFTANGLTVALVRNMILSGMEQIENYAAELFEVMEGRMEPAAAYLAAKSQLPG
jgi:hypothetical protein